MNPVISHGAGTYVGRALPLVHTIANPRLDRSVALARHRQALPARVCTVVRIPPERRRQGREGRSPPPSPRRVTSCCRRLLADGDAAVGHFAMRWSCTPPPAARSVFPKLGVASRTELARLALLYEPAGTGR